MSEIRKEFEAVILNSYEHDDEKKWKRTFIGNLVPDSDNREGYSLFIPEGISVSGRLRIQPKQGKEQPPTAEL